MVALAFAAVVTLSAIPLLRQRRRWQWRRGLAVFFVAWLIGFVLHAATSPLPVTNRPVANRHSGYLGSGSCRSCHPGNYDTWHASYHRTMTQLASPESVLAPFDDTVEVEGRTYEFTRRGDEFWVRFQHVIDPDRGREESVERRIVMTTGSHHYQVYWFSTDDSRKLAHLPIVYLKDQQHWVPRQSSFVSPSVCASKEYAAGFGGEWNLGCIRCHATQGRPKASTTDMQTDVAELGISCEACHGPGEAHVLANHNPLRRYRLRASGQADPTIVNPARLGHQRSAETCGQCHAVQEANTVELFQKWIQEGYAFRPGDYLSETRIVLSPDNTSHPAARLLLQKSPELLTHRFWPDGMVRVTGREFNGLSASPCFQRGEMDCLSCHDMHQNSEDPRSLEEWANDQLDHRTRSSEACLQCHQDLADQLAEHTHHAAQSAGSDCLNCHMPHTTYGLLKAVRSHQIDSPNVAATVSTGRPNACNLCHLDQTLAWTDRFLQDWYGQSAATLSEADHEVAASLQWLLEGNAAQRVLIAWALSWEPARQASGDSWQAPYLALLFDDPYDAIRLTAYHSLQRLPGYEQVEFDFLEDGPTREAARRRVLAQWSKRGPTPTRTSALLFGDGGQWQQERALEMLGRRDDEPITLAE